MRVFITNGSSDRTITKGIVRGEDALARNEDHHLSTKMAHDL